MVSSSSPDGGIQPDGEGRSDLHRVVGGVPDLDRLPTGQRGWGSLIAALARSDDRRERHFLEMKSRADLNDNVDRAKVAKFILGAANRPVDHAARYLDGHAVMVLGVAHQELTSIPAFEAHELGQYVARFTGIPGPAWDYQWVTVDRAEVVVITVDPPKYGDPVWSCMSDGPEGLVDGKVYTRDGSTRPAKGSEIRLLSARAAETTGAARLDVSIGSGGVVSSECDPALLDEYVQMHRTRLLPARPSASGDRSSRNFTSSIEGLEAMAATASTVSRVIEGAMRKPEDRTVEEYQAEIEAWERQVREEWPEFVDQVLAAAAPRTVIRIDNLGDTFLEGVRIDLHVAGEVFGVDAYLADQDRALDLLPGSPRPWGPRRVNFGATHVMPYDLAGMIGPSSADFGPPETDGLITFNNSGSVDVVVTFDELRPRQAANSDDDLVLALPGDVDGTFRTSWRVTAKGHHAIYEGALTLQAAEFDLTSHVRDLVMPNSSR